MALSASKDQLVNLAQAMELSIEEIAMVVDMPPSDSGATVIYVAAKAQASQMPTKNALNKLGVCSEYRANDSHSVSPMDSAVHYFQKYKKGPEVDVLKPNGVLGFQTDSKLIVIKPPMHGSLMPSMPDAAEDNIRKYNYQYNPNKDYVGLDKFEFEVSLNGKSLRIYYQIEVFAEDVNMNHVGYCNWDNQKYYWKISQSGEPEKSASDYAAWQSSANLSALIAKAQQTFTGFTDLSSTALGQTTGEGASASITLDQNAAGHGWYIDPTPLDNTDDYLPTSNATVWQAKAGSEAEGKMDMLSVLLHEYGHALGLEHSANGADFMAASLQPGVRKLPSAAELTWMSQLVAELKKADGEALTLALSQRETEHAQGERGQDNPSSPLPLPSPLSALGLLPPP